MAKSPCFVKQNIRDGGRKGSFFGVERVEGEMGRWRKLRGFSGLVGSDAF
jgi:hypothetical protein